MLKELIGYLIPVVTILFSYTLGRLQATHSEKIAACKEAYETFYLPFVSLLYDTQIWSANFSGLDIKTREKLFRMVADNIKYMDRETLEWVDILYAHHTAVILDEIANRKSVVLTPDRLDEVFGNLTIKVLDRAILLAKKLHQPPLGEHVRALYLESPGVLGI